MWATWVAYTDCRMDASFLIGGAGAGVLGFSVAITLPWLLAFGRSRRARQRLGAARATVTGLTAGNSGALSGSLRARDTDSTVLARGAVLVVTSFARGGERLEEAAPNAVTRSTASVDLVVGSATVQLEDVQVVVGSRELDPVGPDVVTRLLGPLGGAVAGEPRGARVLRAGDRVIARGEYRERPGDTPAQYRESRVVPQLVAPSGGFVSLAYVGVPLPLRFAVLRCVVVGAVTSALWITLAGAAGILKGRMVGTCRSDIDATLEHGDPLSAADAADKCGDSVRAARGAWLGGDFDRASMAFKRARFLGTGLEPSLTEVGAHLLAGRLPESASAARQLAKEGALADLADRTMLECYADALDARTGDPSAGPRLEARVAAAQTPPPCALLAADLVSGKARIETLARTFHPKFPGRWLANGYGGSIYNENDRDDYAFVLLDGEEERGKWSNRPPEFYPLNALRGAKGEVLFQPLGIEQRLTEINDHEAAAEHALRFATFDSYLGEHREAAREVSRALVLTGLGELPYGSTVARGGWFALAPRGPASDPDAAHTPTVLSHRRTLFLAAVLAARAGEVDHSRALLGLAPEESNGTARLNPYLDLLDTETRATDSAFRTLIREESWPPTKELWALAEAGDGTGIFKQLVGQHGDGLAVLPFLGRFESLTRPLRPFVASSYPPPCWTCGPHVLLDWVAGRRAVAQGLGASDVDAALHPIAEKLRLAFVRRDISVPLYVLGRVTEHQKN
jgi:hypothetical protein